MSDRSESLPAEQLPGFDSAAGAVSATQVDGPEVKLLAGTDPLTAAAPAPSAVAVVHPLDRIESADNSQRETERIKLAWAKLLWLLSFLAVLLAISYLVPLIAENTQYALTRGKQRAEHDFAIEQLPGSPLAQFSQASRMVSQVVMPSVVHSRATASTMAVLSRAWPRLRTKVASILILSKANARSCPSDDSPVPK